MMLALPPAEVDPAARLSLTILLGALLLTGIVKCIRIGRRETTNSKCVLSLAGLLLAWLVLLLANNAFQLELLSRGAYLAVAVVGLVFATVACTLSVLGLFELRQGDRTRYQQGRSQAVWTLVLMTVVGGLTTKAIVDRSSGPSIADTGPGTPRFRDEARNLEIAPLRGAWGKLDAKALPADACYAVTRADPRILLTVSAEDLGAEQFTTANLRKIVVSFIESQLSSPEVGEPREYEVNGLVGERIQAGGLLNGRRFDYDVWLCGHNGYTYQVTAWISGEGKAQLSLALTEFLEALRPIDLERVSPLMPTPLPDVYESRRFGYRLALDDPRWSHWTDLAEDLPEADFGVGGEECFLVVVPVRLFGLEAAPSALTAGLLASLEIDPTEAELSAPRPVEFSGLRGQEFDYLRRTEGGNEFAFRIRVLYGEDRAFLVAAWTPTSAADLERDLARWIGSFEASDASDSPREGDLTRTEMDRHGLVFDATGAAVATARGSAEALPWHAAAARLQPHIMDRQQTLLNALLDVERYEEVLERLEVALEHLPDNLYLRSYSPYAKAHLGRGDEALEEYLELFRRGFRDVDDLRLCVDLLRDRDELERALQLVADHHDTSPSIEVTLLAADLKGTVEGSDRAADLLVVQREQVPFDARLDQALIGHLIDAERYAEARKISQGLLDRGTDHPDVWTWRADAECGLGWYQDARETLEQALAKHPESASLSEYLDYVTGQLGEGGGHLIAEGLEPLTLPPEVLADPPQEWLERQAGTGSVYWNRVTAVRFVRGEPLVRTDYRRAQVLTPAGASHFSTFSFLFDPLREEIGVDRVLVRDAEGKVVGEGDPGRYYVVDETSSGQASHDKVLKIPIPGLAAGSVVEVQVTRRDKAPSERMAYLDHALVASAPVHRGDLVLTGDLEAVRSHVVNDVSVVALEDTLIWTATEQPGYQSAGFDLPYQELVPMVWIGDVDARWAALGEEYLGDIAEVLALGSNTRARAAELVQGIEDEQERILTVARFVRDELRYEAIEFGRRAWTPDPAQLVLSNRYGDCKDHALLLHQLLRALEIPSSLALVDIGDPVRREVPSLAQFNHMVVYCPTLGGGRFVDCTDKHIDVDLSAPIALGGTTALVLDEPPRLVTIPAYEARESRLECWRTVILGAEDVVVEERLVLHDFLAWRLRAGFVDEDPEGRRVRVQRMLSRSLPGVVLRELEVSGLDDPRLPLELRLEYELPGALSPSGDRLVGRLPAGWERYYLAVDAAAERLAPFQSEYPVQVYSEVTLRVPEGASLELGQGPASTAGPFGSAEFTRDEGASGTRLILTAEALAGRHQAERFADFVEFRRAVLGLAEVPVTVRLEE